MSRLRGIRRWLALPALALVLAACDDDDSPTGSTATDVTAVVTSQSDLSTLGSLLASAGLVETLRSGGPFTVFAPSNSAFGALPAATLQAVQSDADLLREVLLDHVVAGNLEAANLRNGQVLSMLSGRQLRVSIEGTTVRIGDAVVAQTDLRARNGVVHVLGDVIVPEPAPDLVDVAVAGGFSTLVAAVQAAGLEGALRGDGPFTVFAPTDGAFLNLPAGTLESLLANPQALADILTFHVVPGRIRAADLSDGQELTTLQGRAIRIRLGGGARAEGANITATDIEARNGIIHVIDAVILPSTDLVDAAVDAGFSTLVTAVQAAGLEGVLRGEGPFTVFAPTNAAFDALPAGTVESLLGNVPALTSVLTYHVVPGRIRAADLREGLEVRTVEGRRIRFSLAGGATVNGVNITATDIETDNGIIHVIDAVLLPPDDLVDTAVGAGFSTLVTAVQAAGLEEALRGDGPFTVFAPANDAFAALPAGALEGLLADIPALQGVLTYHVVPGRIRAADLRDGLEVTTLEGRKLRFTLAGGAKVNGVDITATDIETENGVIHVIDAVLLPPQDIVDTAIGAGFSTLVTAVQVAGLEPTLRGGSFTVFAPTNDAFAALPPATLNALLADPAALSNVVSFHVVPGRFFAGDLRDGQTLTTVQGHTLRIRLGEGATVNGVDIVATDVLATNGVVHVIDAVLVP